MEQLHRTEDIIAQKYRILDTLGQGGSGTTYLAQDLENNQQVALKAFSLHRMTDWKMMELFEREAKILEKLNHPRIPQYLGYFHIETPVDSSFYIAQQLVKGQSLATLVESGWRTHEDEVRRIAIQVLEILVYLHSLKPPVVHRDIKPQNIIRRDDGQVFLVDFGAVQHTYYTTFMGGSTVVGTYGYMAPEQFRGQAVPATDLYALGATLLFLLTHHSPADLSNDELKINFRDRVQISEEFADWLEKMLEPDTEDRFSSAQKALEVLQLKRKLTVRSQTSVQWKKIVAVGVAVTAVAIITLLNSYKSNILRTIGFKDLKNITGTNTLLKAAVTGDKEVIKQQLAKGADVNAKDENGNTPLHKAAEHGNEEVVELLIANGANVNAKAEFGGYTPLHEAARYKNKEVVELLITKGADVNAKDEFGGYTPLHKAAEYNNKEVVELLIAKGADVNAKGKDGYTPLHFANNQNIVEMLIAKGADVNAKNDFGRTPAQEREEREARERR
ncbi:ankyrin repeat domain-containing protein [Pelatocladus sp. BLCC-F211]|uniref:ankyrin repeat domain-containing protein n=1 Tax=Pelatocladus sp. BLCC-F211 TaxID=3342752 RepID=UPI0035BA26CE